MAPRGRKRREQAKETPPVNGGLNLGLDELEDLAGQMMILLHDRNPDNPAWWLKLTTVKIQIGEWGET